MAGPKFWRGHEGERLRLGSAVGLALALHLAVLAVFAETRDSRKMPTSAPAGVMLRVVEGHPPSVDARPGVRVDSELSQAPAAVEIPQSSLSPPGQQSPVQSNRRYFDAAELDAAPRPVNDWILHPERLEPEQRYVIRVAVWISDRGRVDAWRIVSQTPPGSWPAPLLAEIADTPMQVGLVKGEPVPSTSVFELVIDTR